MSLIKKIIKKFIIWYHKLFIQRTYNKKTEGIYVCYGFKFVIVKNY